MPVKKKIAIWAPFRGGVGTKQAAINYAFICQKLGLEVVFIELCDEWSGLAEVADNFPIISLTNSRWLKNFVQVELFSTEETFSSSAGSKAARCVAPCRGLNPILLSPCCVRCRLSGRHRCLISRLSHPFRVFPRFLDETPSSNLYYRLEDKLRMQLWRKYYDYPEALLTMTRRIPPSAYLIT